MRGSPRIHWMRGEIICYMVVQLVLGDSLTALNMIGIVVIGPSFDPDHIHKLETIQETNKKDSTVSSCFIFYRLLVFLKLVWNDVRVNSFY
jgi:hypothetical protein